MKDIIFNEKLSRGKIAYERLASLQNEIINTPEREISLRMTNEGQCGKTFVFMIACLRHLAIAYGKKPHITVPNKIYNHLDDLDVLRPAESLSQIGYDFTVFDSSAVLMKSVIEIVDKIPVKLSDKLRQDIISRVGEIFNNAFEHAEAKYVIGGRYQRSYRKYCFACYDTGVGITNKVRRFHRATEDTMSDKNALAWALHSKHSTAADITKKPRGQGMTLLREFAKLNKGMIRICTGKSLYVYSGENNSEKYADLTDPFIGTLFEMDFNADVGMYTYKNEIM
jgi:hypothetical protein